GRLSPAALATALGFATALWLGFHPQQLSPPPWLAVACAALASVVFSPFARNRIIGVVLGLASILGPASLLAATLAASFKPYCYSCSGRRVEGDLVLVITRTWPSRGLEVLGDGRVVACAVGEPLVGGEAFATRESYGTLEGESWSVRRLIELGAELVYYGCRGEVLVVVPRDRKTGVERVE
ncbi:hypothetical protein apy_05290, partial [Aeropyrum pernix]